MRGSIVKRGNVYSVVVSLGKDSVTGKYKTQWFAGGKTKKEAETKLMEIQHQIDSGTYLKPGKTTVGEYLERWLRDYCRPTLAPRTYEGYEHMIRKYLIANLGNYTLTGLKPEHIQRYYADRLAGGLSGRTVHHHHVTLHGALKSACRWGLLVRNPADSVTVPSFDKPEMHTMSEDDLRRFLTAAKGTEYFTLFYVDLFTGLRRSELLALKWTDVDLLGCQIHVIRSVHHLRTGETVFRQPKTVRSRRMVALSPSTVMVLREYRKRQEELFLARGKVLSENDLVFLQANGLPYLPDTITHAWLKLARRVGLRNINLHSARHTHASLMLQQGVHPKVVSERLGHAGIQITLDIYSHTIPAMQDAAAKGFDSVVGRI